MDETEYQQEQHTPVKRKVKGGAKRIKELEKEIFHQSLVVKQEKEHYKTLVAEYESLTNT
jgi:5'-deoxynucleotidase YfbR-like HD superfamily hydrolase